MGCWDETAEGIGGATAGRERTADTVGGFMGGLATVHAPPPPTELRLPRDLPRLKDRALCEFVGGRLIERQRWRVSAGTVRRVARVLGRFVAARGVGDPATGVWFRYSPGRPDDVRRPDLCFIRRERLGDVPDEGFVPVRPDLTVDAYHAGDGPYDVDAKMADYVAAGVPLAWLVNPAARTIRVFRPGRAVERLSDGDTLDGGDVLPGFAVVVRDLMPDDG